MIKIFFCLIFLAISDAALGLERYKFIDSLNGWLKLHAAPVTWKDAWTNCNAEGAALVSPLNENIIENLRVQMLLRKVDSPIYLGVNALRSNGYFVSPEGVNLDDMPVIYGSYGDGKETGDCLVFTSDGKVSTSSCLAYLPYFCYKKKVDKVINECGTFDDEYKLNAATGSCYKLHEQKKTWSEAQKICLAEAGHLVVLNNREEALIVRDLIPGGQQSYGEPYSITPVGILNFAFVTVTGERIDDVYNQWKMDTLNKDEKMCVFLLTDANLANLWCDKEKVMFVCEKNPNAIQFERVAN